MAIIKTHNLSYTYSKNTPFEKKALNKINLEIKEKSFLGIIGHTGSGKSTLVQHFNGLLKPSEGEIYVEGKNIWRNKEEIYKYRFKIGLVFQYPEHQLFEETVFKDIAFGPKNMGLTSQEIKERVMWAIKTVNISSECLQKSPFELSGGEKRKVALAGVISMDPDVLILDEPTAGLDPKSRTSLLENIVAYHKKRNNTVILISHNMDDIVQFCDNVILMSESEIYMNGPVKEIFYYIEKLTKAGITPPTITEIFYLLTNRGYKLQRYINTVEEAVEYFKIIKKKK